MVCAFGLFAGSGRERTIRAGLVAAGVLTMAGLIGPAVGGADWRVIGMLGCGVVLPVTWHLIGSVLDAAAQEGTTMTNPSRIRRGSDGEGPATITRVPVPDLC